MDFGFKHTVLVTGFGPFGNHIVNASWEAVKELCKLVVDSSEWKDIKVVTKEIPVSYEDVANYIPTLWKEYNPLVILHVGVSHKAHCLTIESCAHNYGYIRPDIYDKCPDECKITPEVLNTGIDVNRICENINKNSENIKCNACISCDAGRYLCEYIYYKSLKINPMKTLFVHVPDFDKYSSDQTAKGLYNILCYLIKEIV
ncbi:pyroglutamyl-peptidase 1 [Calliopsis andreniformis]|uniref:pyroglutamyl-peptidase 1 n=1 Tax=Calliopsis andreniformis TaxID=337506 RepID=UPI003FCD28B3